MPGALDSAWCIEAGRPERWAAALGLPSRGSGWLARSDQVLLARLADGHRRGSSLDHAPRPWAHEALVAGGAVEASEHGGGGGRRRAVQ